jgi:transposase InsO family protein
MHMDLTGRLPRTEDGNEYIMVVKDYQTKYVWLIALPNKEAETIAGVLIRDVFKNFGPPEMLVSDRGTEFRNKIVDELSRQYRIKRICTTGFNPRSNGFVENHNATLKNQLFHYANAKHTDWDVYLDTIQQSYNTTVNAATGYTPFYAMMGREMQTPDTVGIEEEKLSDEVGPDGGYTWADVVSKRLEVAWTNITERAHQNYDRANRTSKGVQEYHEESVRVRRKARAHQYVEYAPGDKFYRKRNPVREFKSHSEKEKYKIARKLQARFEGPYVVTERINPVLYAADINGKQVIVHAVNMKPEGRPSGRRPDGLPVGPVQVLDRGEVQYSALPGDSRVTEESKATGGSSSVSRGGSRRLGRRVEEENDWNETS